ncbi:amino acid permease-domain-containing protein [Gongronella butleri]|nr:amino acid permease-domain-containing protein [Gongronella butleri]
MVGVVSRGGGLAQGATVFGSNIVYAIHQGQSTNDWQARGFGGKTNKNRKSRFIALLILLICVGFAGMAGRLPDRPDFSANFSFDGTVNNAGSYANAIYYVIFAYGAYLSVLSLDQIKSSNLTVAANLFTKAFGGVFGSQVLPVFVGMSSFGFVGVVTYSGSRVILEYAREGHLPFHRLFGKVHPTLQTPIPALLLLYVISLIFLLAPPPGTAFQFIMSFSNYGDYFFVFLCALAVFLLRFREPDLKRPFRAPLPLVAFAMALSVYTLVFVYIPPTSSPKAYPYWVPYVASISFGIVCIVLWVSQKKKKKKREKEEKRMTDSICSLLLL